MQGHLHQILPEFSWGSLCRFRIVGLLTIYEYHHITLVLRHFVPDYVPQVQDLFSAWLCFPETGLIFISFFIDSLFSSILQYFWQDLVCYWEEWCAFVIVYISLVIFLCEGYINTHCIHMESSLCAISCSSLKQQTRVPPRLEEFCHDLQWHDNLVVLILICGLERGSLAIGVWLLTSLSVYHSW